MERTISNIVRIFPYLQVYNNFLIEEKVPGRKKKPGHVQSGSAIGKERYEAGSFLKAWFGNPISSWPGFAWRSRVGGKMAAIYFKFGLEFANVLKRTAK